jgi:hypothetical protein
MDETVTEIAIVRIAPSESAGGLVRTDKLRLNIPATGNVDGTNTDYTFAEKFDVLMGLYRNGVRMESGYVVIPTVSGFTVRLDLPLQPANVPDGIPAERLNADFIARP